LDDPKVNGKSKMKKAFCEPGNVGFCPPIEVLAYFGGLIGGGAKEGGNAITISRSLITEGTLHILQKKNCFGTFRQGHSILET